MRHLTIMYGSEDVRALADASRRALAELQRLYSRTTTDLWPCWIDDPHSRRRYEEAVQALGDAAKRIGVCLNKGMMEFRARPKPGSSGGGNDARLADLLSCLHHLLVGQFGVVCDPLSGHPSENPSEDGSRPCPHDVVTDSWFIEYPECNPLDDESLLGLQAVTDDLESLAAELEVAGIEMATSSGDSGHRKGGAVAGAQAAAPNEISTHPSPLQSRNNGKGEAPRRRAVPSLSAGAKALAAALELHKAGKEVTVAAAARRAGVDRSNLYANHRDTVRAIESFSAPDRNLRRGRKDGETGQIEAYDEDE